MKDRPGDHTNHPCRCQFSSSTIPSRYHAGSDLDLNGGGPHFKYVDAAEQTG